MTDAKIIDITDRLKPLVCTTKDDHFLGHPSDPFRCMRCRELIRLT